MTNNYQRIKFFAAIATQVVLVTCSFGATPTLANEDEALLQLCSSFPHNSRCEGKVMPISLKKRDGEKAKCLLSGSEKAKKCKVLLQGNVLSAYVESGERLKVLKNVKNTTELTIPLSTIKSFEYSEDSKTNVTAVIMLGLPGLFFKKKTANFNIQYAQEVMDNNEKTDFGRQESETADNIRELSEAKAKIGAGAETELGLSESKNDKTSLKKQSSQQLLFVVGRGQGRDLRQQLEKDTGLSAELNSIDE